MPACPSTASRRQLLALGLAAALPGPAAAATHEWRPWPTGRATPALALPLLDGTPWRLAAQRGRVVLLNFWATWCEPCRAELPSLQALAQRQAAAGLIAVAVNHRETAAAVQRYAQASALTLPLLLDAEGRATRDWTPGILPTTVLVGRDGRAAGAVVGEIDWEGGAAQALLAPLLGPR